MMDTIPLTGRVHVVAHVTPPDPLIPPDPMRVDVHANLVGVSGVGSGSGRIYRAVGSAFATVLQPDGPPVAPISFTGSFILQPEGPPTAPDGPPLVPLFIDLTLTFSGSGVLTGGTATIVDAPGMG